MFSDKKKAKQVSAGDGFSLILSQDGEAYSCGKGNFGRLGHGKTSDLSYPSKI